MKASAPRRRTFRQKPIRIRTAATSMLSGPPGMKRSPAPARRTRAKAVEPEGRLPPSADLLQPAFESRAVPCVGLRGTPHRRRLLRRQRPDHARGRTDDQGIFGILLAFGNDRACADDAAAAYSRTVHDDRAHPDERVVFKRATVHDHIVADRAVAADRERKAGVGVAGGIVLHVGAFADLDPFIVAAQHRAEPHAGRIQKAHLADHDGGICDEIVSVSGEFRPLSVEFIDRHSKRSPLAETLARPPARDQAREALEPQASTPLARSVIRTNVPDIKLQKPESTVAITTNSKRRRSIFAPRNVLRMMMKGAAKTRNGTAANVFGATPSPSSPNPAGRAAIA